MRQDIMDLASDGFKLPYARTREMRLFVRAPQTGIAREYVFCKIVTERHDQFSKVRHAPVFSMSKSDLLHGTENSVYFRKQSFDQPTFFSASAWPPGNANGIALTALRAAPNCISSFLI